MEIIGGIIVFTLMLVLSGIKVVKDYNQLVVFRFGKFAYSRGAGIHLVLPLIDQAELVDTRLVTFSLPLLDEMTMDHVPVKVSAVCIFQIYDAQKRILKVDNLNEALEELVQTSLRTVISQHDLKHLISDRGRVSFLLKSRLDKQTREWGVKLHTLEIKEIKIAKNIKKALLRAKQQKEESVDFLKPASHNLQIEESDKLSYLS
ncbi:MAG: SPFH domain-containing protein [Candidatus Obscuribacterales bacterium]|nr:SPFH domain-containing protein [Candidatus Obscuribacterales bacterium]